MMRCDDCSKIEVCKYQTTDVKKFVTELEENIRVQLDLDNEGENPFSLGCAHFTRR